MPKRFRLKENHPTNVKFEKLLGMMEELGINIEISNLRTIITDTQTNESFELCDIEHTHAHVNMVQSLPPAFETCLIVERE